MSCLRIPEALYRQAKGHMESAPGEHFGFFLASTTFSGGEPVFLVHDIALIADRDVRVSKDGWSVNTEALLSVINRAVQSKSGLVEFHNHGGAMPRFSRTDHAGFEEFVPYVLDSLPQLPYGATVWGDDLVYGEYFLSPDKRGKIRSIAVTGARLDQVVSLDDDGTQAESRFTRQLPWFSEQGQRKLGRIRTGVVGLSGTGSPLVQNLVYLGVRNFLLIEPEDADDSNLNRLVTASFADIGTSKLALARRLIKSVAPNAVVDGFASDLREHEALDALKGVDVLFGAVDNDGARLVLAELCAAYGIPYFDLAVGIDVMDGVIAQAGGRVFCQLPGGPCLYCAREIDPDEARYALSSQEGKEMIRRQGYVSGLDVQAPSVVSLNASIAAAAANEFACYVSGLRWPAPFTELDLLGVARTTKSQWVTPRKVQRVSGCPVCGAAGFGDDANVLGRYAIVDSTLKLVPSHIAQKGGIQRA